ncbi:MAG: sporulation protein YqfC [Epulopiscium sp.]|jgi:sporulation protein YqfC|nr:sporulation protein YqfC [Candidatus Epulonipiscium sp.]
MKGRGLKRNVTDALELPKEVLLNLPLLSLTGREELIIENYKGIMEYGEEVIRVNTAAGVLRVEGKCLLLKQLTSECIVITGGIRGVQFQC